MKHTIQIPNKRRCSLPPFKIKPVIEALDCGQKFCWTITAFNLPETWEKSQGEGVKVAVLDTGVGNHDDLKNNILPGYNFIVTDSLPLDKAKHGTHVTGIICAENNGLGVIGVAPKSKVIPIKVLDDEGSGDMLNVCKGILWAADNGADIISMSLGCPDPIDEVRDAIRTVTARGIPVFCAAGNANLKKLFYPAGYKETISIAAVDRDFKKAEFSNVAENLDFFAPGKDILSTIPGNKYGVMSGTSMSCPFAASIAALMLSYSRNHKTDLNLTTPEHWKQSLRKYTTSVNEDAFKGFGIIDPRKFVEWIDNSKTLLK